MLRYCVTLRSGGDYKRENVISLATQVKRYMQVPHEFVCFTDRKIDHEFVTEIKLEHNWPGFWATLEMWNNKGPTILTGLDTVVFDNIDRLGELALTCKKDQIYMCRPRNKQMLDLGFWATGITVWNGDFSWIVKDIEIGNVMRRWRWEQMYVSWRLKQKGMAATIIQDLLPGWYAYKALRKQAHPHKPKKPENITIMTFAGKPRPHECEEPWIAEAYNMYKTWDFTIPMETLAKNGHGPDPEADTRVPQDMLDREPEEERDDLRPDERSNDEPDSA